MADDTNEIKWPGMEVVNEDVPEEEQQWPGTAVTAQEVPEEEPSITLNERQTELDAYAKQLVEQSGSYEVADLEAAGFAPEDIKVYEDYAKQEQGTYALPMEGDGILQSGGYSTDMYRNMSFDQAADYYYNIVLEDPSVTPPPLGFGYAIYTDPNTGEQSYITPPSPNLLSDGAKSSGWDIAAVGLANALGNAIELGGAALEYAGVDGATEAAGEVLPTVNTGESAVDALIAEGVPMLVAGGGTSNAVYQSLKNMPRAVRLLASVLSGEMANAAVSETDAATIAIGENAMVPIMRGLDLEDSAANDVIEGRMNVLLDGLMAGGVLTTATQGIVTVGKMANNLAIRPIRAVLSTSNAPIEERVINDIFQEMMIIDAEKLNDPEVVFQVRDRIAQIVEQNKDVFLPLLTNADEEFKLTLDTLSALERGIDGDAGDALVATIQGMRNAAVQSNQPLTSEAVRGPMKALDTQTDALLRETGGETAAEQTATMAQAADSLAGMGRAEITAASEAATAASEAYYKSASELVADLANDVELSDEIRRLSSAVGTEIDTSVTASREQIVDQLEQGYVSLTRQKNDLYNAISGGEVDVEGLLGILDDLPTEQITQATQNVRNSSPVRGLLSVTKRVDVEDVNELGEPIVRKETDEERLSRVAAYLDRNGMDFGFFYRNIRPELSQMAEDMFQTSPAATRNIRGIVSFIDEDMVNHVARSGDEDVADAAIEALDFYKETYAPLFRDGRLADYSRLYDTTVGRTAAEDTIATADGVLPPRFRETDYNTGTRTLVNDTMRSGDPASIDQFKRLLSMSEAGADPSPLSSYIIADSISGAYDMLRASGGTEAQLGGFIGSLRQYSEALNEVFPDRAAELNTFIRRVEAAQGNREQLEAVMKEAKDNVTQTMQDLQQSELRFFFRREFGESADPLLRDFATTSNPQQSFRTLMLSEAPDRLAAMDAIMSRIQAVPDEAQRKVLQDGVETAYLRLFRDQTLGQRRETGNLRSVLPARIDRSSEELSSLYAMGDVIYKDTPEVMEAVRGVADIAAGIARSRNATPVASMSPTAFNKAAMSATNRLIYASVGPLSKAGTRIRSIALSLFENADATARAAAIRDQILSDPTRFVELARRYNSRPNDEELQGLLLRFMFAGATRATDPATNEDPQNGYPVPLGLGAEVGQDTGPLDFLFP